MKLPASLLVLLLFTSARLFAAEISIVSLQDLDFGQVPPTVGTLRSRTAFCVALEPRGRYRIIASGDGAAGGFALQGASGVAQLAYRVFVTERGRGRGTEVQANVPLTGLRGKESGNNGRCRPPLGSIFVQIDAAELQQARPDRYRGVLSMTVVPE